MRADHLVMCLLAVVLAACANRPINERVAPELEPSGADPMTSNPVFTLSNRRSALVLPTMAPHEHFGRASCPCEALWRG